MLSVYRQDDSTLSNICIAENIECFPIFNSLECNFVFHGNFCHIARVQGTFCHIARVQAQALEVTLVTQKASDLR